MNKFIKELENGFGFLLGLILILLGIVGIFLPIFPGILMIILGLYFIGGRHLVRVVKDKIHNIFWKK